MIGYKDNFVWCFDFVEKSFFYKFEVYKDGFVWYLYEISCFFDVENYIEIFIFRVSFFFKRGD